MLACLVGTPLGSYLGVSGPTIVWRLPSLYVDLILHAQLHFPISSMHLVDCHLSHPNADTYMLCLTEVT